jgi:hypothetical protein
LVAWIDHELRIHDLLGKGRGEQLSDGRSVRNAFRLVSDLGLTRRAEGREAEATVAILVAVAQSWLEEREQEGRRAQCRRGSRDAT